MYAKTIESKSIAKSTLPTEITLKITALSYVSLKLKTFAHAEFAEEKFSSIDVIKRKIDEGVDLFDRGHKYQKITIDEDFPKYLFENLDKYKKFIKIISPIKIFLFKWLDPYIAKKIYYGTIWYQNRSKFLPKSVIFIK